MAVKFIAEASSSHDLSRALAFVDAAAECESDVVKFQIFHIRESFGEHRLSVARELA